MMDRRAALELLEMLHNPIFSLNNIKRMIKNQKDWIECFCKDTKEGIKRDVLQSDLEKDAR